tara:strand:- start:37 stop:528 length:492 start_codon:yes stop_codon:yes gene_type:complete
MNLKICTKCGQTGTFHKDKNNPDGLNKWCHDCKRDSRFKKCEEIQTYLKQAWNRMKRNKKIIRNINFKELWSLWKEHCLENKKQGKHEWSCKYTGEIMTTTQGEKNQQTNISIDRFDNNKDYEVGNIVFCTTRFNRIKGEWSLDVTKKILKIFKEKGIKYEME